VPKRCIDGRDRGHCHRTAAPVRALVEILPRVFDFAGVAADEKRNDMISKIAGDGELAAIQCGVTKTVETGFGGELKCNEIASRRADDDYGVGDLHGLRKKILTAKDAKPSQSSQCKPLATISSLRPLRVLRVLGG